MNQDYFYECAQEFEDLYTKVNEKLAILQSCPSSDDENNLKQVQHSYKYTAHISP